ncbi:MAG: gamma-glutamylcyclotransferase [Limimaricola sp.]|uniref:gamma-glutamylcyclotransferase family protein n=1 Tax=Limimaricola sp. TaxID=2211665 RepID=UPI001DE0AD59|nr:gamma-glutamylcyclotransferase family protein [Limimaricola sp.]MBI1415796.1 gamma-glutamylcyclotransferase [Limimaricola sp.]
MTGPLFFGYGSLVNLATHDYHDPRPATLRGWRRVWRHTSLRDVAFLSVEPHAETVIDGIVARVPGADWAALDAREHAYVRRDVSHAVSHDAPPAPVAVYEVAEGNIAPPSASGPLILSYIDTVVQGFLQVHGEAGAVRFFATTAGWDAPVIDDRAAPRYPRHRRLGSAERDLVDHHLSMLGCAVVRA